MLGLQRALHVAGAKAVVSSLWKVDDAATEALMGEFYRNLWVRRLPRAEALRQAQLAFVRGEVRGRGEAVAALTGAAAAVGGPRGVVRPHVPPDPRAPAYWAAFIPAGDWR